MLPLLDGRPLTAWASKPLEALSTQEVQAGLTLVGSIADSLPRIAFDLFKQVGLYAVTAVGHQYLSGMSSRYLYRNFPFNGFNQSSC